MKRLYAILIIALLVISTIAAARPPATAAEPDIIYRVDISHPEDGSVSVSLELDSSQPLVLAMQDSYGDLATGLASHIKDTEAFDATGAGLAVRQDGNTWYVEGNGRITFTYRVDASGYKTGSEYLDTLANAGHPWPYFPLLTTDLAYLPGYAILVQPRSASDFKPRLELTLPPTWKQALPWRDQPAGMSQLLSNPLFAGDMALLEQDSLLVAVPFSSAAAAGNGLFEYAKKAQALLSEIENQLGGIGLGEGERIVLALLFSGNGSEEQSFYPSRPFSACIPLPSGTDQDPLSDSSIESTSHGMADLLLGQIDLGAEALWLREGSASYFQDLIPYQAGIWGARTFWDRFNDNYDAYREARRDYTGSIASSGSTASSDRAAAELLAAGGASACAALDSEIHGSRSFNGDLSAFLRAFLDIESDSLAVSNENIRSTLEGMTGRDWSGFFDNYISGHQEIPASSFSSLNVARVQEESPSSQEPETSTSVFTWIILAIALGVVFLIPFILEPYTMNPRKPGFLRKKLGDSEGGGAGLFKKWLADDEEEDE
ncbi:MAG: hypothetical protein A2Y75_02950 [Candidatus Solincola sediminis]|uniref:Peptidase M61 N-terminal domain-containing protein n=1 Tax=Candidatus Solincola sediminis TaxID=1797199 RepID=A0A1F2WNW6_9ACTN|nr:MAG: hypothetical protein A2Y75_02950 [Candidatus Solincola sediminis]